MKTYGSIDDFEAIERHGEALLAAEEAAKHAQRPPRATNPTEPGDRVGDDYNRRGDLPELLMRHGWTFVRSEAEGQLWRRPGKLDDGHSARLFDQGPFYVFSDNAQPFEPNESYSKFAVFTLLEHGGDYSAAARVLVTQGFGEQRQQMPPNEEPPPPSAEDAPPRSQEEAMRGNEARADEVTEDAAFDTAFSRAATPWPAAPDPAVYHGLAGDLVNLLAPHTEADPVALLVQLLVAFGVVIGSGAHFTVEAVQHMARLFVVLVGETSKARKGTSFDHVRRLFQLAGHEIPTRSGLSSGEGLIWCVRDPIYKKERKRGNLGDTLHEVVVDEGVTDKRLLVFESEFASTLKVIGGRSGNTLSPVVRDAWDRGNLSALTKNSPAKATGAHISIVGHITRAELRRDLDQTDAASGFGNRFLWLCVRRSKILPEGGSLDPADLKDAAGDLRRAIEAARTPRTWVRTEAARALWREIYPALSAGVPGLLGAVTSRAEAQVVRLALIYALLDAPAGSEPEIAPEHLEAALAVWRYCADSAKHIFGDSLGDPKADEALCLLRTAGPQGMTRTQLGYDLFGRQNVTAERIARVLRVLSDCHLARRQEGKSDGRGRPAEIWVATSPL